MENNPSPWYALTAVLMLITALIGSMCGRQQGMEVVKRDAVKVGYAEFFVDKDNNLQWRWKECKEVK